MDFLSKQNQAHFLTLAKQAPHATLIVGVAGNDAKNEADFFAKTLQKDKAYEIQTIEKSSDKTVIGIEQIQQLYRATRAKKASDQQSIIILPHADNMSEAAQNAFLKLLEEPPARTFFILGVAQITNILPTIRSRCHIVHVKPLAAYEAKQQLEGLGEFSESEISQLIFIAKGSATMLQTLITDPEARKHTLANANRAKHFLTESTYQKITIASQLANKREDSIAMIALALDMLVIMAATHPDASTAAKLSALQKTHRQLIANGNVRLQLVRAALLLS